MKTALDSQKPNLLGGILLDESEVVAVVDGPFGPAFRGVPKEVLDQAFVEFGLVGPGGENLGTAVYRWERRPVLVYAGRQS